MAQMAVFARARAFEDEELNSKYGDRIERIEGKVSDGSGGTLHINVAADMLTLYLDEESTLRVMEAAKQIHEELKRRREED